MSDKHTSINSQNFAYTANQVESNPSFGFDFFDNFKELCFIISGDGEITHFNSVVIDKFGAERISRGDNFFNFIDSALRQPIRLAVANCISSRKPENVFTKFVLDENTIDVNLTISLLNSSNNLTSVPACFIFARDITKERKQELELLRFYYVAQNTVNPLQITDIRGKMVYVNPAFVAASGYSEEELIGKNPSVFSSGKHSRKFWSRMWTTINSGKVWVGEVENRRKNGEPFYTQLLISPILDSEGKVTGFFGIHRDLSEKKTLEKQLIHTQKMESIGTLTAGIAHEVGNPLASISALVQVIQRTTEDDFAKEKLELVKSQVTRISKIIRDLVDFSRPSNYELQLTDINKNIEEAVEIIKVGAKAKTIYFNIELSDQIPHLPLIADQIQQVFVNIILNAVDAITETSEPGSENYINVKSDRDDDNVYITFTDTGGGIPDENLSKIFEPFFTTKKEGKGTGLGLWVSYGIIKSFQGDIKVNSTPGIGTTFIINLPINP
jgi:PAS domain S-box-containing protein